VIDEYTDAIRLLAGVVEQARRDLGPIRDTQTIRGSYARSCCNENYEPVVFHSPAYCAKMFLGKLEAKLRDDPNMSPIELGIAIMEIIE